MTIPITVRTNSPISVSQDRQQSTALSYDCNVEHGTPCGKQKARASADFLGVFDTWKHVVGWCCITTTFLDRSKRFCDGIQHRLSEFPAARWRLSPARSFRVDPAKRFRIVRLTGASIAS
jgi:hypothetical protein